MRGVIEAELSVPPRRASGAPVPEAAYLTAHGTLKNEAPSGSRRLGASLFLERETGFEPATLSLGRAEEDEEDD